MNLAEHLRPLFPARVRGRGSREGEVEFVVIEDEAPASVRATVHGRESHAVTLRVEPPASWSASCTCPVFRRTGACRHVWAVVLEADERTLELARRHAGVGEPSFTPLDPRRELWQARLAAVHGTLTHEVPDPWRGLAARLAPAGIELLYLIDLDDTRSGRGLVLRPFCRERSPRGRWSRRRPYDPGEEGAPAVDGGVDGRIFRALRGTRRSSWSATAHLSSFGGAGAFLLDDEECAVLLPLLCESTRAFLHHHGTDEVEPLAWDEGEPWALGVSLETDERSRRARLTGFVSRRGERMGLDVPHLVLRAGFLFLDHSVARFDARGAWALAEALRDEGPIEGTLEDAEQLARSLVDLPGHPLLEGEGLHLAPPRAPHPHLSIDTRGDAGPAPCHIRFEYGEASVAPDDPRGALRDPRDGTVVRRQWSAEREALRAFLAAGGRRDPEAGEGRGAGGGGRVDGWVDAARLDELVLRLSDLGWSVEVGGQPCRGTGEIFLAVRSGVDWFDLEGGIAFGDQRAELGELLSALDEGRRTLKLSDGSLGLVPDPVLREWAVLTGIGERTERGLRFARGQGWLLDQLLAEREDLDRDEAFDTLRAQLSQFEGLEPVPEPEGFLGTLRPYQRLGLGWFDFLRGVGFGGCLADDMGLGKTVQVLALLRARQGDADRRPSLVVVPRSLLFNWRAEAEHFTPELRLLPYHGPDRAERTATIADSDLVLTTYGTLRRDIMTLKEVAFDYVILDEAQAIKNARSHTAKAARLLEARHRLALSGTPIENHLGELWSLFEFLNPGMLGRASAFRELVGARGERVLDEGGRALLASALRPFFLRRTKEQVLPELPPRVEQILWCELGEEQRVEYDALREHYRALLLHGGGMPTDGFEVLRALLRLRQAACHPGLVDQARMEEGSAKLEALLPHLEEIVESGHKALVFSQFTTHLGVVRRHLEPQGVAHAYLDGKTRDRESVVRQFREDPDCPLFLMSLKAGGLGLNLVEADYVFLLDPWWNPAAEAQAIDRAHRIGRTRTVVAYRLIARDTVEEKILQLQAAKRALADAVLSSDDTLLRSLSIEDLERLFS